ncbi:MAG: type I-C CRISPR-associated protein Cas8c/Csd1 [Bacteroidales bacterium]|nr:type I-C CRISPR-associated protein Cas8c/Csd1 [Bacteroidales bacterium]
MTWITKLYETYENCGNAVGIDNAAGNVPLLPIGHTSQKTQIEITIDEDGNFQSASIDPPKEAKTVIIPCTMESEARSSGNTPHPLFDNLKYLAPDSSNPKKNDGIFFEKYLTQLEAWCDSEYAHPKAQAIYAYVKKGTIISDLRNAHILNEKMESNPQNFYVRFCVYEGDIQEAWKDVSLRKSYIGYYVNSVIGKGPQSLCYASGKYLPVSRLSPRSIRRPGDGAYLISGTDESNFTFRGRFDTRDEAMCLSYDASQKAHKALKWLIEKQGYVNSDQVFVAWGTKNQPIPQIWDPDDVYANIPADEQRPDTAEVFARSMTKALSGYAQTLTPDSSVVVMGLDSTNGAKGRLSITYYQELAGSEFLKRICHWYQTTKWYPMTYMKKNTGETEGQSLTITGVPTPRDIFFAAYGRETESTKKIKKATVSRIMRCIVEGKPIPYDLVLSSANRAAKLIFAGKSENTWDTNKTLNVACALIRKYYNDRENERNDFEHYNEVWKMDLDTMQTDRNYLFGRLLAYARNIEEYSIKSSGNNARQTNAERMIPRFRQHPAETWGKLYEKLLPYMAKFRTMGPNSIGNRLEAEMNAILDSFKTRPDDFSDAALTPVYLLGYQSQLTQFDKVRKEAAAKRRAKEEAEQITGDNSTNGGN